MTDDGFDEYAEDYDAALARGVSLSGDSKLFFARRRIEWTADIVRQADAAPRRILDFGCGTGTSCPLLLDILDAESVVGLDTSAKSIAAARAAHPHSQLEFQLVGARRLEAEIDLAFCNGVFHHIVPSERPSALECIRSALRPEGLFVMWENNPWNPGTRIVMRRIPFDRDAITLSASEARRLVSAAGFEVIRTDFLFVFPRFLRSLRWTEPHLSRLPIGAQYGVSCRKT